MRLDEGHKTLIAQYAAVHGQSMAEFMLAATLDRIEDGIDLRDWRAAKPEFDQNPVTHSNEEILREFGLR